MTRIVLRVAGIFCLGGALLAGFSWWETTANLFPVDEIVTLQERKIVSVSFVPANGVSENPNYLIKLQFKDTPSLALRCTDIQSLDIRWAISENIEIETWNHLSKTSSENYDCDFNSNETEISFSTPPLDSGVRQYLQIAVGYGSPESRRLAMDGKTVQVLLRRGASLDMHYGSIDQGVAVLLGVSLGTISIVCLLVDLALAFVARAQRNPIN